MTVNALMLAAGLGLVLVALVTLVAVRRRTATSGAAAEIAETVTDVQEHALEDPSPGASEVRALRAHVRVLEEALQRAVESTVEQPDLAAYRTQVRVAVEAVARRTAADADARAAVARVATAIGRLDADPSARTVLPTAPRRPVVVTAVAPEPLPEPVAPEVAPAPITAVEEEVVLPVPPPAPADHRRTKRRLRRSAA